MRGGFNPATRTHSLGDVSAVQIGLAQALALAISSTTVVSDGQAPFGPGEPAGSVGIWPQSLIDGTAEPECSFREVRGPGRSLAPGPSQFIGPAIISRA
jgi:hypothetical protein